jgi:hypothetical protein
VLLLCGVVTDATNGVVVAVPAEFVAWKPVVVASEVQICVPEMLPPDEMLGVFTSTVTSAESFIGTKKLRPVNATVVVAEDEYGVMVPLPLVTVWPSAF